MQSGTPSAVYVGLDMGGTHTDAAAVLRTENGGRLLAAVKTPTDHDNLMRSTRRALDELFRELDPARVCRVTFGTTLLVNAVVRGACEPVGLALSAGPGLDPAAAGIGPYTAVIAGGLDHRGEPIAPLDEKAMERAARAWLNRGVTAFACAGKFSPRNPAHEETMERILLRECRESGLTTPVVSCGHLLSGELNFPRRAATAYWNAAVRRLHDAFADAAEAALAACGVSAAAHLLQADGGAVPPAVARAFPVRALLSGPAASVMGVLALRPTHEDLLILDMGGTTTDIAVLAKGLPVPEPDGLIVNGRPTLARSLKSISLGFGGDSLLHAERGPEGTLTADAGPEREGPAMAFGGEKPTLLDALNVLGHARAGNEAASRRGVTALAAVHGCAPEALARTVLQSGLDRVAEAVRCLLDEVNSRPVHTLASLLEKRRVEPRRAVLVGGPAPAVAPLLSATLGLPVEVIGSCGNGSAEPWAVANAAGAALTRPAAELQLFADTQKGRLLVPALSLCRPVDRAYTLEKARHEACSLLRAEAARQGIEGVIDVTEARSFAMLDGLGNGGRDIRVSCRLQPGIVCPIVE